MKKQRQAASPSPPIGRPGRGRPESRKQDAVAVILAADILRWVLPKVGAFPRNLRFGLGARIESALTDVLENLVSAQYDTGRRKTDALVLTP